MAAFIHMARELIQARELLWALTWRDIRVKYKQALFGLAWAVFLPVLAVGAGLIFRCAMAFFSSRPLIPADLFRLVIKALPWLLFASIVNGASNSLIGNTQLITRIYFPREVIPLSAALSALFDFAIALLALVLSLIILTLLGWGSLITWTPWALLAPVFLILLILLAVGLGLFLAAANLFFRDVKYIVQVLLQFGLFFSLVYFTYEELGRWGWLLLLNPVAALLEALRLVLVDGQSPAELWPFLALATAVTLGICLLAAWVFEQAEYRFAEYA